MEFKHKASLEDINSNVSKYKLCQNCYSINRIANRKCIVCNWHSFLDTEKSSYYIKQFIEYMILEEGFQYHDEIYV